MKINSKSKKESINLSNKIINLESDINFKSDKNNLSDVKNNSVTPWETADKVDYSKLIKDFGTSEIDEKLFKRIEKITHEMHYMLKRKIFFSHRDLNILLDKYEKGEKFFIYTGRGPSNYVHLGHLIPWIFTKWLCDKFNADLYFQMSDDEKFLFKENLTLEDTKKYFFENSLDIVALGFNPKKTFIFQNTEFSHFLYKEALKISKNITFSTAKAVFGFNNQSNLGQIFYTSMQASPILIPKLIHKKDFYCLVPLAIDQDPHFRVARDVIEKVDGKKPAIIHSKFLPSLKESDKMSATGDSAIYTTDDEKSVSKKVSSAKTGGRDTLEEQKKFGGNPDVCRIYEYYYYLFELDDSKLLERYNMCKTGKILCGECKKELALRINVFLKEHQKKRELAKSVIENFIINDSKLLVK